MGSKELQPQESKLPRTSEENKLAVAINSVLIKDSNAEEIKQVLRYVMMKVGLRSQNWPQDEEKIILIAHIIENFGGNRIEEIKLAFDMAIAGKLDLDDVKCYENFSCAYFSQIMNAYRKWAVQTNVAKKEAQPEPKQKIFSQDELDDGFREDVERQYASYLKGYDLKGLEFNVPILLKDGLIKEGENPIDLFRRSVEKGLPHIYIKK